jgi:hypothetical protein
MDAYGSAEIDAVEAFYTRFQSAMTQVPHGGRAAADHAARAATGGRATRRLQLRAVARP